MCSHSECGVEHEGVHLYLWVPSLLGWVQGIALVGKRMWFGTYSLLRTLPDCHLGKLSQFTQLLRFSLTTCRNGVLSVTSVFLTGWQVKHDSLICNTPCYWDFVLHFICLLATCLGFSHFSIGVLVFIFLFSNPINVITLFFLNCLKIIFNRILITVYFLTHSSLFFLHFFLLV